MDAERRQGWALRAPKSQCSIDCTASPTSPACASSGDDDDPDEQPGGYMLCSCVWITLAVRSNEADNAKAVREG